MYKIKTFSQNGKKKFFAYHKEKFLGFIPRWNALSLTGDEFPLYVIDFNSREKAMSAINNHKDKHAPIELIEEEILN